MRKSYTIRLEPNKHGAWEIVSKECTRTGVARAGVVLAGGYRSADEARQAKPSVLSQRSNLGIRDPIRPSCG